MDSFGKFPASYLDTVTLPLKLFGFIGIDFFDDPKTYVKNRCKFILFVIGFFFMFSSQVLFVVITLVNNKSSGTLFTVANALPCLFIMCQTVIRSIIVTRKKHLLRNIIVDIAHLWPSDDQSGDKNKIKDEWLGNLKTFTTITVKLTMAGVIVYVWITILVYFVNWREDGDTPYLYPIQLYYPFKIDSLWKYLVVYLVLSVVATVVHACVFYACDVFLYALTMDVCIMLRMLEYDLVNLRVEHDGPEADRSLANLKQIVKTHQKLLRLAENLNDIFGVIMFAAVAFSSVILCFFGFIAIMSRGKYQIFINVSTVLQVGFIIFYTTLPGENLANTSRRFAYAAYESSWYNGDVRFRRIIYFIIARSQKECKLQAMGYTDMNLRTFCKMCSSAYSYLSLLNQMFQDFELP